MNKVHNTSEYFRVIFPNRNDDIVTKAIDWSNDSPGFDLRSKFGGLARFGFGRTCFLCYSLVLDNQLVEYSVKKLTNYAIEHKASRK